MCRYLLLFRSVYNFSLPSVHTDLVVFPVGDIQVSDFKWWKEHGKSRGNQWKAVIEKSKRQKQNYQKCVMQEREENSRRKYRCIEWILDILWMAGNERKSQQKETQQQSNFFFHSFSSIRLLWFLLKMSHTLYPDRHTEQAQNRLHQNLHSCVFNQEKEKSEKVTNFLALFIKVSLFLSLSLLNRCTHSSLFLEFLFLLNHFFFVISCCCFCCCTLCLLLLLSFFSSRRCHHHHLRFSYLKHWGSCVHRISKHALLQKLLTSGDDDFVWGNPVINLSFLSSVIMLFFCPLI